MSKYIRTKNGVYDTSKGIYTPSIEMYAIGTETIYKKDIINQADTIEELVDEYVIVNHNIHQTTKALNKIKEYFNPYDTFYGAIWTDKGLIYVAKMNSEKELELI